MGSGGTGGEEERGQFHTCNCHCRCDQRETIIYDPFDGEACRCCSLTVDALTSPSGVVIIRALSPLGMFPAVNVYAEKMRNVHAPVGL